MIRGKEVGEVGNVTSVTVDTVLGTRPASSVSFGARQLILPYWLSTIVLASSAPPMIDTWLQVGDAKFAHCL